MLRGGQWRTCATRDWCTRTFVHVFSNPAWPVTVSLETGPVSAALTLVMNVCVYYCSTITKLFAMNAGVCVFNTAGPIIKLCAGGEWDSEGHVL